MSTNLRLCTLMVHNTSHNTEELQLNPELFGDLSPGDFIQIYEPQNYENHLILKVPVMPPISSRLEISLTKVVAESNNLKPFSKVVIEKIDPESASLDFVELSFKRQYLQRGNFFRFQNAMFGRPVYLNQNVSINGIQAQIQEMHKDTLTRKSGIITDRTKFVFRSRSARIIWLVQISAEMWEFDQNGDLYFEKFLRDFVSPLLDRWKTLGASHMLTVVFFSRTFYLERVTSNHHPDLYAKRSFGQTSDGFQYQDSFKIVIENIAEFDQTTQINRLRQEFWEYPRRIGWKVPAHALTAMLSRPGGNSNSVPVTPVATTLASSSVDHPASAAETGAGGHTPASTTSSSASSGPAEVNFAVPSDAVHGNLLEAINMSLNILSKHYLDRDLLRTNNSIVMISAGQGVFKVKPNLNQITKQRMLDNAFGLDFISLAKPTIDTVPLFLVDCRADGVKNFYEMPHWMRVSFIDCKKEVSEALESAVEVVKPSSDTHQSNHAADSADAMWGKMFTLQPTSSLLTAQLVNSSDMKQLAAAYANTLPLALREIMSRNSNVSHSPLSMITPYSVMSREPSAQLIIPTNSEAPLNTRSISHEHDVDLETLFATGVPPIPTWGTVSSIPYLANQSQIDMKKHAANLNLKSTFLCEDLVHLKALALNSATPAGSKGAAGPSGINKNKLKDIIDELPILQRDRGDSIAESLNSMHGDGWDDDDLHARSTGKLVTGTSLEEDEKLKMLENKQNHRTAAISHRYLAASWEQSSLGEGYLADMLKGTTTATHARTSNAVTNPASALALVEDLVERQASVAELAAAPAEGMSKEKLLALMQAHDRNIFKGKSHWDSVTPTAQPAVEADKASNSSATSASSANSDGTTASPHGTAQAPSETAPPVHVVAPASGGAAAVAPSAATPAAASNVSAEPHKPLTRDEKLRAQLINSSSGGTAAARLKQMQLLQQQQQQQQPPVAETAVRTDSRTLSIIAHQQLRLQQQQQQAHHHQGNLTPAISTANKSSDFTSPPRAAAKDGVKFAMDEPDHLSTPVEKSKPDGCDQAHADGGIHSMHGATVVNSAIKRFQRLSSKNFQGAKSHLTSTPSSLARVSAEVMARAKSVNPNTPFAIIHGKIVPIHSTADSDAKLKSELYAQYIREYAQTHCVNPFRVKDGQSYTHSQSHNRRRWVHVFPQGKLNPTVDYGLNWKSLTQPAILPLTTDYVPPIKLMDRSYDVNNVYQLLVDKQESPFLTSEDLMQELICLRLTQEYQLIEEFDSSAYSRFINNNGSSSGSSNATPRSLTASSALVSGAATTPIGKNASAVSSTTPNGGYGSSVVRAVNTNGFAGKGMLKRMDSVHGRSKELKNFYILSMGHRIQFIQYDEAGVNVTIYRSKEGQNQEDEKSVYNYNYESWSPQVNAFVTMTQVFHRFNAAEFRWNKLDNIVVGNIPADTYENAMNMKRLRFSFLPPECYTDEDVSEYMSKIDLLVEFLNKYAQGGGDIISINKDKQVIEKASEESESRKNSVDRSSFDTNRTSIERVSSTDRTSFEGRPPVAFSPHPTPHVPTAPTFTHAPGTHSAPQTPMPHATPTPTMHLPQERAASEKNRSISSASSVFGINAHSCLGAAGITTAQTPLAMALYKKTDAHNCDTAKLVMRVAKNGTPNWLYCRYDKTAYTYKALHLEFHWVVCDAWLIDEMITLLYRRCQKWGLRMVQIPQYYSVEDLNVHPFRALPYVAVPRTQREVIPGVFPSPLRMVERLLFSRRNGWLFENEYRTDWSALSMTAPSYLDRDRDLLGWEVVESAETSGQSTPTPDGSSAAPSKPHAFSSLSQSLSRMVFRQDDSANAATAAAAQSALASANAASTSATRALAGRKPASSRRLDRQYMHHTGLACVRVAGQGFLWMQNVGTKISDINPSVEEKREIVAKNLTMLTQSCERVTLCYELLVDVVERAMDYAHLAQIGREVLEECLEDVFTTVSDRAREAAEAAERLLQEEEAKRQELLAIETAEAAAAAEVAAELARIQEAEAVAAAAAAAAAALQAEHEKSEVITPKEGPVAEPSVFARIMQPLSIQVRPQNASAESSPQKTPVNERGDSPDSLAVSPTSARASGKESASETEEGLSSAPADDADTDNPTILQPLLVPALQSNFDVCSPSSDGGDCTEPFLLMAPSSAAIEALDALDGANEDSRSQSSISLSSVASTPIPESTTDQPLLAESEVL